jgi:hypothetical protein
MQGILRGVNRGRNYFNSVVLFTILFVMISGQSFGQLSCSNTEPSTIVPAGGLGPWSYGWQNGYPDTVWNAHVYQLNSSYNPFANDGSIEPSQFRAHGVYKGMLLRDGVNYLPVSGMNFDTQFNDPDPYPGNGSSSDTLFFQTGISPTQAGGCETQLSNFGLAMRGRYIPEENGIYRIRIGSDDGSYFRMFSDVLNENGSIAKDVNGNDLIHVNWNKDPSDPNFDGIFDFFYEDNIRNYFVELEADQDWFMKLNYYEKNGNNRLSFEIELYFGPGQIQMGNNASGSASFCGINPDPTLISSVGPAVFADGEVTEYFWQYATSNDESATWTTVPGATDKDYKIPTYDANDPENNWSGTRYYRRGATNTIVEDDGTNTSVDVFSNVLEVTVNPIADLDRNEFGNNEWIGHIYSGVREFSQDAYRGRYSENAVFSQNFPSANNSGEQFFTPEHGCSFLLDNFTIRYKMRLDVSPGTYDFFVNGDDGYRLSINGNTVIDEWAKSSGVKAIPDTYQMEILEDDVLELVLDYYEIGGGQSISFDYDEQLVILPLEWGYFSGQSCGDNNCLNWSTLQEKNTSHFLLERSKDGFTWETFGEEIEAKGFSNTEQYYQSEDNSFENKFTFYRIRQIDLDDTFSYSDVIRVENNTFTNKLMPFPNPTTDLLFVDSEEGIVSVELISQDQRIRAQPSLEKVGAKRYQIDMRQYPSNHYLVTILTNQSKKTYKIMKR